MKKRVVHKTKAVLLPDANGAKKQCQATYTPRITPGYSGRADIYTLNFDTTEYIYKEGRTYTVSGVYRLYQYGVKIIERPIVAEDIISITSTGFPYTYNSSTLALSFEYTANTQGICTVTLQYGQVFSFTLKPAVYKKVCSSSLLNPVTVTFTNEGGTQAVELTGTVSVFPENDPSLSIVRPLLLEDISSIQSSNNHITVDSITPIYNSGEENGVLITISAVKNVSMDPKYSTVTIDILGVIQSLSVTQGPGTYYVLTITPTPIDAHVLINGDEVRAKSLLTGSEYTYSIIKNGLDTITGTGVITEDTQLNITMQARLTIQPDPSDATVIINEIEQSEIVLPYNTRYTYAVSKPTLMPQYGSGHLTQNLNLHIFLSRTHREITDVTTTSPATGRFLYEPYVALATGDYHIVMAGEGADRQGALSYNYGGTGGICEFDMALTKDQKLYIYKINGSRWSRTGYNNYNSYCTVALFTGPTESSSTLVCVPGAGGFYTRLSSNDGIGGAGYAGGLGYAHYSYGGSANGTNVSGEIAANSYAAHELDPTGCTGGPAYINTSYYAYGGSGYLNTDLITEGIIKNVIQTPGSAYYTRPITGNAGPAYFIIEKIG